MATKTYKGNKTDFSYFINMALQDRMSWKTLRTLLNDVAPTLNETREVISILLKELESLHCAFQKNKEVLKKHEEESETHGKSEMPIEEVTEVFENPEEIFNSEMQIEEYEDVQSPKVSNKIKNGFVEIEEDEDESQETNDTHHD